MIALTAALAGAIPLPVGHAQPAPAPATAPTPDALERAKDLYRSAEAAMKDGRFDDAARDYGAAYDLSKDPALFFKIGHAHERAGKCDIALVYYARYLRDGKPAEQFIALTRERIAACGGSVPSNAAPDPASPGAATGSAAQASPDSASAGRAHPTPPTPPAGPATTGTAPPAEAGTPSAAPAASSGSAAPTLIPPTRQKVAWVLGGSALALVTLGGVLAYAASSSENDIRDLYAGFAGRAPTFDGQTKQRYNDLIDEGRRYQHLSWLSFGLAGAAAIGTAVLFTIGGEEPAQHARIAPIVTPRGAGVAVRF